MQHFAQLCKVLVKPFKVPVGVRSLLEVIKGLNKVLLGLGRPLSVVRRLRKTLVRLERLCQGPEGLVPA